MFEALWNLMAVIGILFSVMCIILLGIIVASSWGDDSHIRDPRRKDDNK